MLNNHFSIVSDFSKFDKFFESISETNDETSFSLVINYPCSSTTFCDPIEAYIKPGVYLFEVWGAQGGSGCHQPSSSCIEGANGGHSAAVFNIRKRTRIFLNIGGKGTDSVKGGWYKSPGGNNGGGDGGFDGARNHGNGGGGGGGTDIRLNNNDISSRIIVAGGGGGSQYVGKGGVGGGERGGDGFTKNLGIGGKGGDQYNGGESKSTRGATSGDEWKGGDGSNLNGEYLSDGGSGGGGGYFGGGGGACQKDHDEGFAGAGGGGSGYISNKHINFQGMTVTEAGDKTFLSPNGSLEVGHSGSGAVKIIYYNIVISSNTCKKKSIFYITVFIFVYILS